MKPRLPAPTSLSLPGIVLLLVAAALYLIARSTGAGWDIVILCGLIAVLALGAVWPALALLPVRADAGAPTDTVVGHPLPVHVTLTGHARGLQVRVRLGADGGGGGGWVRADAPSAGDSLVVPERRGVVHTLTVDVRSSSPLGLVAWRKRVRVPLERPIDVAPKPIATPYEPRRGANPVSRVDPRAGAAGHETTRGVREYVDGDPIRLVHWPATARTGAVMVRELEGPELPRLVVVVDLRGAADDAEIAASRAAGLAIAALASGVRVELATVERAGPVTGTVQSTREVGRRLARAVPGRPAPAPAPPGVEAQRVRAGALP